MALPALTTAPSPTLVDPVPSNAYGASADLMGRAAETYAGVAQGSPIMESMNSYLNPYYKEVMESATSRMIDQRNQDLMKVGDAAEAAGAFGGSRHGILDAEVYDRSQRNIAEMEYGMLSDRFNTAAALGAQDVGFNLAGAQGMQGLAGDYFNTGERIRQNQMADGTMQQQLLQAILSGASGQFDDYMSSPYQTIDLLSSVMSRDPRAAEQTQSYTPGLYDYIGLGLQTYGSWLGRPA